MGHSKDKLDPDYFILAIIPWSLQIAAINLLETFSTVSIPGTFIIVIFWTLGFIVVILLLV